MGKLTPTTRREIVEVMAKHLPPSAARLRLWDIAESTGAFLRQLRDDIEVIGPDENEIDTVDAITALAVEDPLEAGFLSRALRVLRPGGRLIMVDPDGDADKSIVQRLESAGFTRILVERAPVGVLMRGEKPHTTNSTFARIRVAADADPDELTLATYTEPYIFVLVRQYPNKPVWKLEPGEQIQWEAVTLEQGSARQIIAFTSLPKAVAVMQQAVMQGVVNDVNKVGKFSTATAQGWDDAVLLNPPLDALRDGEIGVIEVDPTTAEAPDE